MATRIIFQIFLFLSPFLVFFIYTILSAEFRQRGDKTWPLNVLFLTGTGIFVAGWFIMIFMDQQKGNDCITPPRLENGVLIPAQRTPCESTLATIGQPLSNDPGLVGQGVSEPDSPPEDGS